MKIPAIFFTTVLALSVFGTTNSYTLSGASLNEKPVLADDEFTANDKPSIPTNDDLPEANEESPSHIEPSPPFLDEENAPPQHIEQPAAPSDEEDSLPQTNEELPSASGASGGDMVPPFIGEEHPVPSDDDQEQIESNDNEQTLPELTEERPIDHEDVPPVLGEDHGPLSPPQINEELPSDIEQSPPVLGEENIPPQHVEDPAVPSEDEQLNNRPAAPIDDLPANVGPSLDEESSSIELAPFSDNLQSSEKQVSEELASGGDMVPPFIGEEHPVPSDDDQEQIESNDNEQTLPELTEERPIDHKDVPPVLGEDHGPLSPPQTNEELPSDIEQSPPVLGEENIPPQHVEDPAVPSDDLPSNADASLDEETSSVELAPFSDSLQSSEKQVSEELASGGDLVPPFIGEEHPVPSDDQEQIESNDDRPSHPELAEERPTGQEDVLPVFGDGHEIPQISDEPAEPSDNEENQLPSNDDEVSSIGVVDERPPQHIVEPVVPAAVEVV